MRRNGGAWPITLLLLAACTTQGEAGGGNDSGEGATSSSSGGPGSASGDATSSPTAGSDGTAALDDTDATDASGTNGLDESGGSETGGEPNGWPYPEVPNPDEAFGFDVELDFADTPVDGCPPGELVFAGTPGNPDVWNGGGATCTEGVDVSGQWGILENIDFALPSDDIESLFVLDADFVVVRHVTDVGIGQGTSNGTSMLTVGSRDVVFYDVLVHDKKDLALAVIEEIDHMGMVWGCGAHRVWGIETDIQRMAGDSLRTGANITSPCPDVATDLYMVGSTLENNGENPVDFKQSSGLWLVDNDMGEVGSVSSSSGEGVVTHENSQDVHILRNDIHDVVMCLSGATSGGWAEYTEFRGNRCANAQLGISNRGGTVEFSDNRFENVAEPVLSGPASQTETLDQGGNTVDGAPL